ncbi:YdeI/OmpD-associated family protein [Streptomyces sp. NPDC000983]|uniref:YdeI/OmpD-associated family protein n=1 Tax=Streptomyces sp. NPDC000983 TaxID=3154373 RepID=UPI0033288312
MSDVTVSAEAVEEVRPAELPTDLLDDQLIGQLVDRARASGLQLTGDGGLLQQLTKRVLESALEGEITDHLGYEKHDPAGAGSGNSRNGARSKTVLTDVGPVQITVPDDLAAALTANSAAAEFFETLDRQNRFAILYRIQDAKKAETRARRIEKYVAMLTKGEKLHP